MQFSLESFLDNPLILIVFGVLFLVLLFICFVLGKRQRANPMELSNKISILVEQQAFAQNQITERLQAQERALTNIVLG